MWYEVQVKTTTEAVEAVSNFLVDIGAQGVVIEDPNDAIYQEGFEGDWDLFDKDEMEFSYEGALLKGYLVGTNLEEKINSLRQRISLLSEFGLDPGEGEVTYAEVKDSDWANEWKKYFKPFRIGDHIVIKPTWETFDAKEDDLIIEIDPGSAFGSGTHETTGLCIELISEVVRADTEVFDIGCGSGILGIAAAMLGAKHVTAVDLDDAAVIATKDNADQNGVGDKFTVKAGNLVDVVEGQADLVVANIIADIIILLAGQIRPYIKEGGQFICSGIILDKLDEVLVALEANGFEVVEVRKKKDWAAILSR